MMKMETDKIVDESNTQVRAVVHQIFIIFPEKIWCFEIVHQLKFVHLMSLHVFFSVRS